MLKLVALSLLLATIAAQEHDADDILTDITSSTDIDSSAEDSELLAEKPKLCIRTHTSLDDFCCSCDSLHKAKKQLVVIAMHKITHQHLGKKKDDHEELKKDHAAIEGFRAVEQCLADFKKCCENPSSCSSPSGPPHQIAPTASPSNQCSKNTGGTCGWLSCDSSRKASCVNSKCVCGAGKCAIGGKCVSMTGAPKSGLSRRLLLDLQDNDEFRLDEGVADMQLTKPVQDRLHSQLNELQAEGISYTRFCSAW